MLPQLGHIEALTAPWKLFQRSTNSLRTGNFSFTLGSHRAISLSSSAGRDTFFTHPKLAFGQGYDVLFSPHESRPVTQYAQDEHDFLSTIKSMTTTERLSDGLQIMMSDINTTFNELGPAGTTRPFDSLYELVFQLTTCAFACREIGADPVVRKKALKHLKDFINNETPTAILLPNLPSLPKARKALGALGLHSTMRRIITQRKKSGQAKKDCIQPFIEMGKPDVQITTHLVSILDAGVISTGAIAPCIDPDWMAKVRAEIAQLGAKYATNDDREASLAKQLLSVPLKAWETELPLMDLCVKETIRLHFQLPMMLRRNISGEDIEIPGDKEVIPKDAIIFFYPPAIMEDATVYSNPGVWDPSRFLVTRSEDKNKFGPHTFIGWGSGRHPCRGMRARDFTASLKL
ncbi:hypothetical protein FRB98_009102 [Tulasnella sp. 332]|nr:hypothetical protein FRB98_009102 [Tulasnella sp. 332]